MRQWTYKEALEKGDAFKCLGQVEIFVSDENFPFGQVIDVESSGSYRFSAPDNVCFIIEQDGLRIKMYFDFEMKGASGQHVSLFDREKLRDVMQKLPRKARWKFADLLQEKVLPDLQKRTAEIRQSLNKQWDSEDCVRGLIAMANTLEDEELK